MPSTVRAMETRGARRESLRLDCAQQRLRLAVLEASSPAPREALWGAMMPCSMKGLFRAETAGCAAGSSRLRPGRWRSNF